MILTRCPWYIAGPLIGLGGLFVAAGVVLGIVLQDALQRQRAAMSPARVQGTEAACV